MGRYFGTDGFRGEAGVTLTAEHAYKVGRFLGWYFVRKNGGEGRGDSAKIVIGKDTRRSGYMLEYALASGITASGADAYVMHVTTTPSVAHVTRVENFDCGIMISASHNPYYDNGIKLFNGQGEKMDESTISLVEDYIDGLPVCGVKQIPFSTRYRIGRTYDFEEGRNRYIAYLLSLGVCSFRGKRVGLDCANGASWNIAKSVFDALGATTYVINCAPDGCNINENAGSTHIEGLCAFVKKNALDVGFAYDGDADRCICVDENGEVVNGDKILYIYGRYLKERSELSGDTVVTTVMSNFGLYKAFDEIGIKSVKTAVGDRFVHEYMQAHGNSIGGEQSGHIIFSKYATTGDGILTSIKMLEVMIEKNRTLSALAAPVKDYPQKLVNVKVCDKQAALSDEDVNAAVKEAEQALEGAGRVLVRASGTEPLIRVMAEAETQEKCDKITDGIVSVIKAKGYAARD